MNYMTNYQEKDTYNYEDSSGTELLSSVTEELEILLDEYKQCVNNVVTHYVTLTLQDWLNVLPMSDILYAINQAAEAPKPSLRYIEAICRRMEKEQKEDPKRRAFVRRFEQRRTRS